MMGKNKKDSTMVAGFNDIEFEPIISTKYLYVADSDSSINEDIIDLVSRNINDNNMYKITDHVPGEYNKTIEVSRRIFDNADSLSDNIGPMNYLADVREHTFQIYVDMAFNNLYGWVIKDVHSIIYQVLKNMEDTNSDLVFDEENKLVGMLNLHKKDAFITHLLMQLLSSNLSDDKKLLTYGAIYDRIKLLITEFLQRFIIESFVCDFQNTTACLPCRVAVEDGDNEYNSAILLDCKSEENFKTSNLLHSVISQYIDSDLFTDEVRYMLSLINQIGDRLECFKDTIEYMTEELNKKEN